MAFATMEKITHTEQIPLQTLLLHTSLECDSHSECEVVTIDPYEES